VIPGVSYYEIKWLSLGEWLGDGFIMYKQTYDYTGPVAALIYKLLHFVFGKSVMAYHALNTILITVQAAIFNSLLLRNKVYNENSYLPAFLYAILAVSIIDFMALSPQLMSLTFILMALRNIIRRIDNQATDELFLSSGIYMGVAAMIYLPAGLYLFVFLFSLILFSSAVPRRLLLYVFGFLLVFAFCGLYFYLVDSFHLFVERALLQGLWLPARISLSNMQLLVYAAPLAVIFFLSLIKKFGQLRLTNFQQKVEQVIWLIFIGGVVTFFLSNERVGLEFLFMVPVVAYFWTHYFILLKRRFFRAVMPFLLVFGLLSTSIYFYSDSAAPVMVAEETPSENWMVLSEKLEVYSQSKMTTPCINASISQALGKELNSYGGAENFYEIFMAVDPDRVLDEEGVMPRIMQRFPEIEERYRKVSAMEYAKVSN